MKKIFLVLTFFIFTSAANAETLSKENKDKAWDCVGIYMANYFLPSGESFEYGMKEKSMAQLRFGKNML